MLSILLIGPLSADAKRGPTPKVPPIISNGVEYRSVRVHSGGVVQAIDIATGHTNWETVVFHAWTSPLLGEEDVQVVLISSMKLEGERLIIRNERGKIFSVDVKTGRVENRSTQTLLCIGIFVLLAATFLVWLLKRPSNS